MTFSYDDLISPNEILADALTNVDDREMKLFTPGWYQRQVHNGIKKLNYEAPYVELFKDIEIPDNLMVNIPSGVGNIIDLFVWSGDNCIINESSRVFHKTNFQTKGRENSYTARNKTGQSDAFIYPFGYDNNVKFYNINNGRIALSDACYGYTYLRIVYYGFPKDITQDDVRYIPEFFREALTSYVTERALFALKNRDAAYRVMWMDAKIDLHTSPSPGEPSKWDLAIRMAKGLDKKYMDDLAEYLSKMFY
jgi:hypothetical protein